MDDEPRCPADVAALRQGAADLLSNLPGLVDDGHLSASDAQVVQYLADRPAAERTARCPVCLDPGFLGTFQAETDEELFALVANHTIEVHGGGPVDAFNTAESVLPHVGRAYREDAAARPWLYQPRGAE